MAYNNGYHTAIKQSPFHALYGYNVRDIGAVAAQGMEDSKEPGAWLEADRHSKAHRIARAAIEAARQRIISLSQTRRSEIPEYHVNKWVLIAAEEIPNPRLSKKLSDKWVGPFKVKEVPGKESKLQANKRHSHRSVMVQNVADHQRQPLQAINRSGFIRVLPQV